MKASLGLVVLVAVASSLVTAGALELLRSQSRRAAAKVAPPSAARPVPSRQPLQPVAALQAPDWGARLDELERRIATLELDPRADRSAVEEPVADGSDDLRDRVLDWVAEEREARRRAAEQENEEAVLKDLAFGARFSAHTLALEHELPEWQERKMADLFLEVEVRRREIEQAIDLATDDPEEVEQRWSEFDDWADRRYEEELGAELVTQLFED